MGAWHKAETEWRRIIEEVPTYGDGWSGLAENLLAQGRLSEADETARRLLAGHPRLCGLALTLGARTAETAGEVDAALATLRQARHECPDDIAPLDDLCRHLFYRGELCELEEALRELVRRQPDHAAAHQNLGTLLQRTGRFQEAAEMFRLSLRSRPDSPLTQLSLGYALSDAGMRSEASAAFEQCVHLASEPRLVAEAQRQLAALAA
jgi:tetratricopeptide (TPR) repeat protein